MWYFYEQLKSNKSQVVFLALALRMCDENLFLFICHEVTTGALKNEEALSDGNGRN